MVKSSEAERKERMDTSSLMEQILSSDNLNRAYLQLLRAAYYAIDKKTLDELPMTFKEKILLKKVLGAVEGTDVEILLRESGLIK